MRRPGGPDFSNIIGAKLHPPRGGPAVWVPERLRAALAPMLCRPLTVVTAGAGYGKTTAVADSVFPGIQVVWYTASPEDARAAVFCRYLAAALDRPFPGLAERVLGCAAQGAGYRDVLAELLEGLDQAEPDGVLLVIDDWQSVAGRPEVAEVTDRLLRYRPKGVSVAFLTREPVEIPRVVRARAAGEALDITATELAFRRDEVAELFERSWNCRLTSEQLDHILDYTGGWVMALVAIGSRVRDGRVTVPAPGGSRPPLGDLFDFLAEEVLSQLRRPLQTLLLKTSVLEDLAPEACSRVLGESSDSRSLHATLRRGPFILDAGDGTCRYHPLFRDFLRREAARRLDDIRPLHARAAAYYLEIGRREAALANLIQAELWPRAAEVLAGLADDLVQSGRGSDLLGYYERIPAPARAHPGVIIALGHHHRLQSDFVAALRHYRKAESLAAESADRLALSQALKGIGQVYLDTIQPALAWRHLRRAYQLLQPGDAEEKARLLDLMAENLINQGRPAKAERYQRLAGEFFHLASRGDYEGRMLLRTGRLEAAVQLLEGHRNHEKGRYSPPRSFRDTPLLLSLLYSLMGEADRALAAAEEGIDRGRQLNAGFVEAIGQVRLGHALLLKEDRPSPACRDAYRRALEISDRLGVVRGRTEVMMGQCLSEGFAGNWEAAERCAREGLAITQRVKDGWFSSVLAQCAGVAAVCCGQLEAADGYLAEASDGFRRCGDSFGLAAACWWLAHAAHRRGLGTEFREHASLLLELCRRRGYDFLLERRTLLGAKDPDMNRQLLLEARQQNVATDYVNHFLTRAGLAGVETPPADLLVIETLGGFQLFRGGRTIPPADWRRESARRLFHLLLTHRRQLVHREEAMTCLWPEADPDTAARDFKVALNTVMNVLEPERTPRHPSRYILRQGTAYYFNLAADFRLDAEEFEQQVRRALAMLDAGAAAAKAMLRQALALYAGDYLQGVSLDEWVIRERERLLLLFLEAATTLARCALEDGEGQECIAWADTVLGRDPGREDAYRLQMLAHDRAGNQALVARTYRTCQEVLQREFGVPPSALTTGLYERLVRGPQAN